jgi:hypothetical protein
MITVQANSIWREKNTGKQVYVWTAATHSETSESMVVFEESINITLVTTLGLFIDSYDFESLAKDVRTKSFSTWVNNKNGKDYFSWKSAFNPTLDEDMMVYASLEGATWVRPLDLFYKKFTKK